MADSGASDAAEDKPKRKRSAKTPYQKGGQRQTPCKQCVENQLKHFEEDRWNDSCCDQQSKWVDQLWT